MLVESTIPKIRYFSDLDFDYRKNFQIFRYFATKGGKKHKEREEKKSKKTDASPELSEFDFEESENAFKQSVTQFQDKIDKLKFGRLSPEHFMDIYVQAYGQNVPITEVCQVITKGSTTVALRY